MSWTRGGSNVATTRSARHFTKALLLLALAGTAGAGCGVTDMAVQVNAEPSSAVISVTQSGAGQQPVEASALELVVGDSATLRATAVNSLGFTVGGVTFAWSTQAPGVASVSADGVVFGVAAGTTTVFATAGGVTASVAVTVKAGDVVPPPAP
jgi:alpha-amylase